MIECMGIEQMQFFASILGDIVSIFGAHEELIVIEAEVSTVHWERQDDIYCMAPTTPPAIEMPS
ncbi:hypothetical protein [Cognatishimia maritima]|uniref:Uncharacterized protein n=1 Tax=Cognatishimia maritima TaxID=870908 RepID=A0A1M5L0Q0_9RHOB|nr:hypothetical protein [Cognatishimia maritima]SHG58566.1 hypothetical protein SAMN04488044_1125 [Cognatishimia maritima]